MVYFFKKENFDKMATAEQNDRHERMASWDRASDFRSNPGWAGVFYADLLIRHYRFVVPVGLRVLELGCSHGDLLSSLRPSFGVGIDFSHHMVKRAGQKHPELHIVQCDAHDLCLNTTFDVIILSDLVTHLWDVQKVFEKLHPYCHEATRIILNFPNNLWRIPMSIARRYKMTAEYLEQNWFAPNDIENLLELSGFEQIKQSHHILVPFRIKMIAAFFNRFLSAIAPFSWFALTTFVVARTRPCPNLFHLSQLPSVSVIIPARNERDNIEEIFKRIPAMGSSTELIFVEGHSKDGTYETIEHCIKKHREIDASLYRQSGKGKGDAVRLGFEKAKGDILMILDADLTVPPEDLPRFFTALVSRRGEFINGVRLVYPMENQAIRFMNMVGNKFFSLAFTWLLGQKVKDTLCGTKALYRSDYDIISKSRRYFGDFDPFGDFDLLFGAAKLNLKIIDLPIRYRQRRYGTTNIRRWRHGWILFKMVLFAAFRIKFI
jgi:2-polyprenyl-3-methyl-5-hydroxy-6-metoxy-1,4-benzoquinol methylase